MRLPMAGKHDTGALPRVVTKEPGASEEPSPSGCYGSPHPCGL